MSQIVLFILIGLCFNFSKAFSPLVRERDVPDTEIYRCLEENGWTISQIQEWYDQVLNPAKRSGRLTTEDQSEFVGCNTVWGYLSLGVRPYGYVPPQSTFAPDEDLETKQAPVSIKEVPQGRKGDKFPNPFCRFPHLPPSHEATARSLAASQME